MVFGLSRNRKQRLNIVKAISLARIVEGKLLMMEERLKASMNDRFKELVDNHYLHADSLISIPPFGWERRHRGVLIYVVVAL